MSVITNSCRQILQQSDLHPTFSERPVDIDIFSNAGNHRVNSIDHESPSCRILNRLLRGEQFGFLRQQKGYYWGCSETLFVVGKEKRYRPFFARFIVFVCVATFLTEKWRKKWGVLCWGYEAWYVFMTCGRKQEHKCELFFVFFSEWFDGSYSVTPYIRFLVITRSLFFFGILFSYILF